MQAAFASRFEAILCPTLLAEIENVLNRPRLRKRISTEQSRAFVDDLSILLELVPDPSNTPAVTRDADDDYLVALALEHEAAWIVTGDKDLLEWEEQAPPAITPASFEELLDENAP